MGTQLPRPAKGLVAQTESIPCNVANLKRLQIKCYHFSIFQLILPSLVLVYRKPIISFLWEVGGKEMTPFAPSAASVPSGSTTKPIRSGRSPLNPTQPSLARILKGAAWSERAHPAATDRSQSHAHVLRCQPLSSRGAFLVLIATQVWYWNARKPAKGNGHGRHCTDSEGPPEVFSVCSTPTTAWGATLSLLLTELPMWKSC